MLLIIEALLLISAALGQDHKAAEAAAEVPLNMALDSVDDQYDGCGQDMANQVEKEYLKKELKNSDFNSAWEEVSPVTSACPITNELSSLKKSHGKEQVSLGKKDGGFLSEESERNIGDAQLLREWSKKV
ncbi:hypothetical protein Q8A67_001228 [Cirrhinus molitorella]|uniref:Uncharacterized protein n=1 Tax=Cirrhinus molitorella TaxID=172907 RepID=A0AA88TZH5_9TELE|nr:hypothetical protein Q8A67_001228 [Cirrhinus molitorella]